MLQIITEMPAKKMVRLAKVEAGQTLFLADANSGNSASQQSDYDSALMYCTGWLTKKHLSCATCQAALTDKEAKIPFFSAKTYSWANEDSLIAPSQLLARTTATWEKLFSSNIRKVAHLPNVCARLTRLCAAMPLPDICPQHPTLSSTILRRFIIFRIHAYSRFVNADLQIRQKGTAEKQKLARLNVV